MMAQNDEFDLRELLGDGDDRAISIPKVEDIPASELTEVESTLKSVQCHRCTCFMVGVIADKRVCRHHKDYPNDPSCPDCARRALMPALERSAKLHENERLAHPAAPNVTSESSNGSGTLVSPITDKDVELPGVERDELDREYWECFNATTVECKDLEPEQLQEIRHKHLRMIRRAKIMNQAINVLMEGRLQLIDVKRRQKIREKDAEFMARRVKEKEIDAATGKVKSGAKSSTGMSAAEKQIKQFCKLNMPDQAIIDTLKAVGTGVPENVAELIAKHRSR
jgi:hypothetical protein